MFGRRRKGPPGPALSHGSAASAAAHTAATSAFMRSSPSNASLSAAAAAAALRARPETPTSVAEVQTKRTMRRTNSNSSMGSSTTGSVRGPASAQLERRGSSGSMTERTFRDPSPNRGSGQPRVDDVPPVPAIPKNIAPPVPSKSHRRAASAETPVNRIASPPPNLATGRGSSLEPIRRNQPPQRSGQRPSSLASVQELTSVERPSSRGSVNFSYPTGLREFSPCGQRRLTSPTPLSASQRSAQAAKQNLVYDPHTRSFIPESELLFYEQQIRDAADRPVKKKKKVAVQGATGTHLSDGAVGGRIKGTAVGLAETSNDPPQQVQKVQPESDPSTTTTVPKRKKKAPIIEVKQDVDTYTPPASDYDSDNSERSPKYNTRVGKLLAKRPSVVREDREGEEAEDDKGKVLERQATLDKLEAGATELRGISPSSTPRSNGSKARGSARVSALAPAAQSSQEANPPSEPASNVKIATPMSSPEASNTPPKDIRVESIKAPRIQSVSPVRTAHFLSAPESLAIKHQPPGRSMSPMKSALKHSPSSRGSSPNGETPVGLAKRGSIISETSDTPTMGSDERNLPRKKSVRVSFDDESNVVLGKSDHNTSPESQVPLSKRGWFGISRGKKDLSFMDDDDSEVMKPRPALPSFGSVREKKNRDIEERSLVKPSEPTRLMAVSPPPLFTTATGEAIAYPVGHSSDHAVGAAIALDQASKHVTDPNEPLPPEVTSVEGSGYISDDASSTYSVEKVEPAKEEPVDTARSDISIYSHSKGTETLQKPSDGIDEPEISAIKSNGNRVVPALALTRASPTQEEIEAKNEHHDMPGHFPDGSTSSQDDSQASVVEHRPTELTPAAVGIAEPEPVVQAPGSPKVGDIAVENQHSRPSDIGEETEESDNNSIYSDAAEDLSDMQGDGFMSLDAVLDSPVVPTFTGLAISAPAESPSAKKVVGNTDKKSALSTGSIEPKRDEGWDKAQQYWNGLSAEKRKEMERASRQEKDEDSTEDEEDQPAPPPRKEKAIVVKPPAKPAQVNVPRSETRHNRTYQIAPGAKAGPDLSVPAMRSSMRAAPSAPDDSVHIRKSMRTGGSMRGSMRESSEAVAVLPQQKASLQKKYRPMSTPQPVIRSTPPETQKPAKNISAEASSAAPVNRNAPIPKLIPTLQRRGSDESDSSFKRARPATEGYSMRRSMRGAPPGRPQSPEVARPGRFSLRSLSPPGAASRASPPVSMPQTMRHTRRFSDDAHTPTLRSSAPDRAKPPLKLPSFGRSKPQPQAKPARTRASRFADSSDDDEDEAPRKFRSRFVDSSDEEEDPISLPVVKTRPAVVKGTPRRANIADKDSSDLPDTDDEKPSQPRQPVKAANAVGRSNTSKAATQDGNALAPGSLRRSGSGREILGAPTTVTSITASPPAKQRRGSLLSVLRRKKPDPSSKIRKSELESAARRDTPLERSRADLMAVRRQDSDFSTASGAASPKLHKRTLPEQSNTNENWPLASPQPDISEKDEEKPNGSGGLTAVNGDENRAATVNGKPSFGTRQFTATGLPDGDLSNATPRRKKKRFQMLRRALGLDD